MNKFGKLLDDVTIVSFPMIGKLIMRYRSIALLTSIITVTLGICFYLMQVDVYKTAIIFRQNGEDTSRKQEIFNLFNGSSSEHRKAEVLRIQKSVDFHREVAKRLLSKVGYEYSRLGFLVNGEVIQNNLSKRCGTDFSCAIEVLANFVPKLFDIRFGDRSGNHFVLTVKAGTKIGAKAILRSVVDSIQYFRKESSKRAISTQKEMTLRMILQKKSSLEKTDYLKVMKSKELFDNKLAEIEEKIKAYHHTYFRQHSQMTAAGAKLKNRKSALNRHVDINLLEQSKKRNSLREKIDQLATDINALELLGDAATGQNASILRELRKELSDNKARLRAMPKSKRHLANVDKFISNNDEKVDVSEFDYNVYRDQVKQTKANYLLMQKEKESLLNKKITIEGELENVTPSINLLKELEERLVELQLMESTIVSDLVFDKYSTSVKQMRKIPLFLITVYICIATIFLLMVAVIARYLTDNKIYDEDDLKTVMSNVKILGSIPEFD